MKYLAFDIGCLECGEPSSVVGVFDTRAEAEQACRAEKKPGHQLKVFELNLKK